MCFHLRKKKAKYRFAWVHPRDKATLLFSENNNFVGKEEVGGKLEIREDTQSE
jgi:hypothetical protein